MSDPSPPPSPAPRPPRRGRAWLLGAVAAVLVVVGAEAGARALGPQLPAPDEWNDAARTVKVAQMERLERAGRGCVDVVVAGDSMARDGFDPAAFTDADPDGRTAYNASLDAAGPDLVAPWLVDQVLPRLRPATVVLVVSSIDLNRNGAANGAAVEAYTSSPAGRTDLLGRLDRAVSGTSALVAHRRELRQPALVADALRGVAPEPVVATDDEGRPVLPGVLGPAGEGLSRRALALDPAADPTAGPAATFARQQLLADFDLGADPAGRIADLVAAVQGAGGGESGGGDGAGPEVVLAVLPTTTAFAALHPGGAGDVAAARGAVVDAGSRRGVPVVDLSDERWPLDHFADTHHLNGTGAARLSAELPGHLAAAGAASRRCGA